MPGLLMRSLRYIQLFTTFFFYNDWTTAQTSGHSDVPNKSMYIGTNQYTGMYWFVLKVLMLELYVVFFS